jgi:outer membrane protein OmpA-like peptidoglycan-associated protein/tetratricopeptide (TPR) repeat protein
MNSKTTLCLLFLALSSLTAWSQTTPDTTTKVANPAVVPVIETTAPAAIEPAFVAPTETPALVEPAAVAPSETSAAVIEQTTAVVIEPNVTSAADSSAAGLVTPTGAAIVSPTNKPLKAKAKETAWKKGNLHYSEQAYAEAIPYYEKILRSDTSNKQLLTNLGECYRLTNNTDGQLVCYGGLIRQGQSEPIQELYYGQALAEKGEMEKAKPYFEKYAADNRGQNLALSLSKLQSYSKNADAYSVTALPFNSSENDMCAVKFHDAVIFSSTRNKTSWINKQQGWTKGGYMQIYATEKDADGKDLVPTKFMGDLDSKFNDGPICFSRDFNTVYFTRNNSKKNEIAKDGAFKLKILEAVLDENGFGMVTILPFNNLEYNFAHPSISQDGCTIYFASDMEGGKGGMDIYSCKKDSSGVWGEPENLGDKVNTAGTEVFPFISAAGVLYFSSNGWDGLGGLDIYETKLQDGKASKVYNMGEPVNSKKDDFGMFLNEDNITGYISSNRKAGGMDDDIYELQILREIKRGKEVKLIIKDRISGNSLGKTKLVINGDTVVTDDKGVYLTSLEESTEYTVVAIKDDYFKSEDKFSALSSLEESFNREITLNKDPKLFLRALITDSKTNALLEGVTIKITDIASNTEFDSYTTTAEGDYFKFLYSNRIGDNLTFLIRIEKTGYLNRTVIFSHTIDKPGEINMNESLNLSLGKVEIGMDLAKMIDMKPIYFDLAKSNIRKDAALELDKIVQVMNEYPNMSVELGAHTDCRSSASSNLKLSANRAKASAEYIVKKGINKSRIVGKGYGESKLLNNCGCEGKVEATCTEEEHAVNRRTEFIITKLQ